MVCLASSSSAEPARPVSSTLGTRYSLAKARTLRVVHLTPSFSPPPVSRAHMRVLPVCGSCPSPLRLARLASQDGATTLFAASQNGHWEVVERLIAAGAKVDAARKVLPTPLSSPGPPQSPPPIHCYCKGSGERSDTAAAAETVICLLLFLPPPPTLPPGLTPSTSTRQKGRVEVVGWLVASKYLSSSHLRRWISPARPCLLSRHLFPFLLSLFQQSCLSSSTRIV